MKNEFGATKNVLRIGAPGAILLTDAGLHGVPQLDEGRVAEAAADLGVGGGGGVGADADHRLVLGRRLGAHVQLGLVDGGKVARVAGGLDVVLALVEDRGEVGDLGGGVGAGGARRVGPVAAAGLDEPVEGGLEGALLVRLALARLVLPRNPVLLAVEVDDLVGEDLVPDDDVVDAGPVGQAVGGGGRLAGAIISQPPPPAALAAPPPAALALVPATLAALVPLSPVVPAPPPGPIFPPLPPPVPALSGLSALSALPPPPPPPNTLVFIPLARLSHLPRLRQLGSLGAVLKLRLL